MMKMEINKPVFEGFYELVDRGNGISDYKITVNSCKKQLVIEEDFKDDDLLIEGYLMAAYTYVQKYTGININFGNTEIGLNTNQNGLAMAILLYVADKYGHRTSYINSNSKIDNALNSLLNMYRVNWI
ncbi:uncharacterized phage protein (possible DNA packaging) [[Clostridium] sordellii]|nr:uncharacterized phage protein (possible DNA packaging) [[Clostridium] sordellii] [Paeniclostridium sordellii]